MMEYMRIPQSEPVVQPIGDDPSSAPLSRLDEEAGDRMPLSRRSNGEHVNPPRTGADQDRGDEPPTYARQHLVVVGATILIVLAVAAVVIRPTWHTWENTWHTWEKETPPTSLCDGVYATSEINRLAHMQR